MTVMNNIEFVTTFTVFFMFTTLNNDLQNLMGLPTNR